MKREGEGGERERKKEKGEERLTAHVHAHFRVVGYQGCAPTNHECRPVEEPVQRAQEDGGQALRPAVVLVKQRTNNAGGDPCEP